MSTLLQSVTNFDTSTLTFRRFLSITYCGLSPYWSHILGNRYWHGLWCYGKWSHWFDRQCGCYGQFLD